MRQRNTFLCGRQTLQLDDTAQKNNDNDDYAPQYRRALQSVGHTDGLTKSPTSPAKLILFTFTIRRR